MGCHTLQFKLTLELSTDYPEISVPSLSMVYIFFIYSCFFFGLWLLTSCFSVRSISAWHIITINLCQ